MSRKCNMTKMLLRGLGVPGLAVVATLLGGCGVAKEYVAADKATFEAVTPVYLKYVDADTSISQEDKDRLKRTVATWKLRIDKAGDGK